MLGLPFSLPSLKKHRVGLQRIPLQMLFSPLEFAVGLGSGDVGGLGLGRLNAALKARLVIENYDGFIM